MSLSSLTKLNIVGVTFNRDKILEMLSKIDGYELGMLRTYMALYQRVLDLGESRLGELGNYGFVAELEDKVTGELDDRKFADFIKGRQIDDIGDVRGEKMGKLMKGVLREFHGVDSEVDLRVMVGRAYCIFCMFESYALEKDDTWYPHYMNSVYYYVLRGNVLERKKERIWQPK